MTYIFFFRCGTVGGGHLARLEVGFMNNGARQPFEGVWLVCASALKMLRAPPGKIITNATQELLEAMFLSGCLPPPPHMHGYVTHIYYEAFYLFIYLFGQKNCHRLKSDTTIGTFTAPRKHQKAWGEPGGCIVGSPVTDFD